MGAHAKPTYASGETPKPGDLITYVLDGRTARVHGWKEFRSAGKLSIRWDDTRRRVVVKPENCALVARVYPEAAA